MRKETTFILEVTHEDTDYNLARQIDNAVKELPKVVTVKIQLTLTPLK
jgi:hypothetical protein